MGARGADRKARAVRFAPFLLALGLGCGGEPQREAQRNEPPAPSPATAPAAPARVEMPRLAARRELALPGRPSGVAVAVRGDDAWLATALEATGELWIWPRDALGETERAAQVAIGAFPVGPIALASGDFAVASMTAKRLAIVDPLLLDRAVFVELPDTPRRLASGRLRGIGDALAVTLGRSRVGLVADGALVRTIELDTERATAIAFAPDGDGIWVGSQSPVGVVYVDADAFTTDGAVPQRFHPLPGIPRAFAAADLEGDGRRELFVLGGYRDLHRLTPALDAPIALHSPIKVGIDLVAADVSGDGREQLVAVSAADSAFVLLGRPDGGVFLESYSEYSGQGSVGIAAADLDGDGRKDIAVANAESNALALILARAPDAPGDGPFLLGVRAPVGRTPLDAAIFRLGARAVVAAVSGAESKLVLFASQGASGLVRIAEARTGPSPAQVFAMQGSGGEGADVVVLEKPASGASATRFVVRTDGTLERGAPLAIAPGTTSLVSAPARDGRMFAAADPSTGRVRELAGDGRVLRELALDPRPVAVIRPTRDDDESLVVLLGGERSFVVRIARHGETLREVSRAPLAGHPLGGAAGDLDGDGVVDVAVLTRVDARSAAGHVETFLTRADGFAVGPRTATGVAPQRLAVGDLDGDDRAEIVVAAQNRHALHLWRATTREGGIGLEREDEIGVGLGPVAVTLGDISGNGLLDILAVNAFSDDLVVVYALAPPAPSARRRRLRRSNRAGSMPNRTIPATSLRLKRASRRGHSERSIGAPTSASTKPGTTGRIQSRIPRTTSPSPIRGRIHGRQPGGRLSPSARPGSSASASRAGARPATPGGAAGTPELPPPPAARDARHSAWCAVFVGSPAGSGAGRPEGRSERGGSSPSMGRWSKFVFRPDLRTGGSDGWAQDRGRTQRPRVHPG